MTVGVLQFPGINCEYDCIHVLTQVMGAKAELVWHKERDLSAYDAIVVPGGFSYGDYLRAGAIARFSPVVGALVDFAAKGRPVLGICNGFQVLTESHLLPGALMRNRSLHFICKDVLVKVETDATPFTGGIKGELLNMPIRHGEGCYFADDDTLARLRDNDQVVFRYCDENGECGDDVNPNGSLENIAGITNEGRNVVGLMPHPEACTEAILGSEDGRKLFASLLEAAA